jgi:class 3 adenylate cyclase
MVSSPIPPGPEDPLSRHAPFVGREDELATLEGWLRAARLDGPIIIAVSGEAGIGKSRLLHEAERRARRSGFNVLGASCQEDLDVPFLPILSALAPAATDLPSLAQLRERDVDRTPARTLAASVMVDLSGELMALSKRRPTVMVFDDLHWADQGTLDVLVHLGATMTFEAATAIVPLGLVVAHRPVLPETASRTLDRLSRDPRYRRLSLSGLDQPALHELIRAVAGVPPSRQLLHEVALASSGNPLLVRAIVERLLDAHAVDRRDGRLAKVATDEVVVSSTGLDDELALRLQRLPPTCRDLLTKAAFLGTEGRLADLEAVAGVPSEQLDDLIDIAIGAGILDVSASAYRFEHPQLRRVLAEAVVGRRRERLHLAVADQLEARAEAGDTTVSAIEIARHLRHAGAIVERGRLFKSNVEAANQAFAYEAWSEAATAFDAALSAASQQLPAGERLAVLVACGRAHFRNHDLAAAEPVLEEAMTLAETTGATDQLVAAALALARGRLTLAGGSASGAMDALNAVLAQSHLEARQRALVLALQAEVLFTMNEFDPAMELCEQAHALAADLSDDNLAANVDLAAGLQHLGRLEFPQAERRFASGAALATRAGDRWLALTLSGRVGLSQFGSGQLEAAERSVTAHALEAATLQNWSDHSLACAALVSIAALRGRFGDAERYGASGVQSFRWSEYQYAPPLIFPALAAARSARGDALAATRALDAWQDAGGRGLTACRLLTALAGGEPIDPGTLPVWRAIGRREHGLLLAPLIAQIELAAAREDMALLEDGLPALERLWDRGVVWTLQWPTCVARLAGMACRVLGDTERADVWLAEGTAIATAEDAVCELARMMLERARVAAARPAAPAEVATAYEEAIAAADRSAALPLLATALAEARAQCSGPPVAQTDADRRPRVVMITDLVDSTPMLIRLGDAGYVELFRYLDHVVHRHVAEHGGVEFKRVGDGIDIWFNGALEAIECARAILAELELHNRDNPDRPLHLRCGLAAGEPVQSEADLFGRTVVEAARVCAGAAGEQIVLTDDVSRLLDGSGVRLRPIGDVRLKGLPGPTRVHEVVRQI